MGHAAAAHPVLAHVLFMDIVGCSKLPTDEQKRIVGRLQELVRESPEFRRSRDSDQLISLPTGDGMALAFFNKLDAAVQCAIEITKSIQAEALCKIRMGVHTGPVFVMEDINHKQNISGAGINRAERVMSCGGEGHILVSDNVAESLRHLSTWVDKIHEIGQCQVKDGWIHVWNLVDGPIGNPAEPKKSKRYVRRRQRLIASGVVALALTVGAALVGAFWLGRIGKGSGPVEDKASIAVLPFADMSAEKNQEYLSDGLAEELLNWLAKIPELRVTARTSSFQFKGKNLDAHVIGEKLNVTTLLEGSIRKQANRAKIGVQLIKASNGVQLWSNTFDLDMSDVFAVQEEIARKVTGELRVKLLGTAAPPLANTAAYDAFLQGKYFLARRNRDNLEKAVGYFEQSLKLQPDYAPAWAALGTARGAQASQVYVPSEEGFRMARRASERALAIDPNLGDAYLAMAFLKMSHDWDWSGADAIYKRLLAREPGNAKAIQGAGSLNRYLGRFDQAIALYDRSIEIDPLNPIVYRNAAIALYYAGRNERATAACRKVLEITPEAEVVHGLLGLIDLAQSQSQQALAEFEKEKHPGLRLFGLTLAYQLLGRKAEADANLAEMIKQDATFQVAEIYAVRGDPDRAFEWLEKCYAQHDPAVSEIKGNPLLKNLERDPRYWALLKRMHLPI